MTDADRRPATPDRSTYIARRLVMLIVLLVVLVVGAVLVRGLIVDDDEDTPQEGVTEEPEPQDAAVVLEDLRADPCDLVVALEVEGVVQRSTEESSDTGGLCSYPTARDEDAGTEAGLVTLQVFGPFGPDAFAGLVDGGVELDTDPPGHWLDDRRALALDGAVAIEVTVRLPGEGERTEREAAAQLLELAAARVPPNELRSGEVDAVAPGTAPEPCPFLDAAATAELLPGADREPASNPDVCSYRADGRFITIERIADPTIALADIRRSSGAEGEEVEWPRSEVEVADGGVWLTPPGDAPTSGELYALVGTTMVHVSVSGPGAAETQALAIDLVGALE